MGNLVGRQPRSASADGPTGQGTFRERCRDVLFPGHAVYLVADHTDLGAMGASRVVRQWQNVGNELGHGVPSDLTLLLFALAPRRDPNHAEVARKLNSARRVDAGKYGAYTDGDEPTRSAAGDAVRAVDGQRQWLGECPDEAGRY